MASLLQNAFDLLLVVIGFGLLVFIHELGHFVAARWAGIRVLAFAVGFGPALVSYRRGMGLRRGSSEPEYHALIAQAKGPDQAGREAARARLAGEDGRSGIQPTEYRFNALPFGGYVKMLGQEDGNPAAVSDAPDSYQRCPPMKRMVVISAGVVANIITALVLFIGVFTVGLRIEPAVIGVVDPHGPAAAATPAAGSEAAGTGLRAGDIVLSVGGEPPRHFNDLGTRVAMSDPSTSLDIVVDRGGERLAYEVTPEVGQFSRLREIGVAPTFSARIDLQWAGRADWPERFADLGLDGVRPGMELAELDGQPVGSRADALRIAQASGGRDLQALFVDPKQALSGSPEAPQSVMATITPVPEYELSDASPEAGVVTPVDHVLGLMPVLRIEKAEPRGVQQGLKSGDIFLRLGEVEFPSVLSGVREIRDHAGREIAVTVLRANGDGELEAVDLDVSVTRAGTVGFRYLTTDSGSGMFSLPPETLWPMRGGEAFEPAATRLLRRPGLSIASVDGEQTPSAASVRSALKGATLEAFERGDDAVTVAVDLVNPLAPEEPTERVDWTLSHSDLERLHGLSYSLGGVGVLFEPERFTLKAEGPVDAVALGLGETRRIAQQTYLTFLRLIQGSVKVEHLRGPVGIAHIGTMIADRGLVWLVFYMALISINLAVVNFLPLPIVDGGQFLMLVYEQIRGKPVPMGLQGALTLAGLALVGAVFLVVTFNDISNLLGR